MNDNIKYLKEISAKIQESINDAKNLFERMTDNKENLKMKVQKCFTKIRNVLNIREGELLSEIEEIYDKALLYHIMTDMQYLRTLLLIYLNTVIFLQPSAITNMVQRTYQYLRGM
jgi:hypothetical protein